MDINMIVLDVTLTGKKMHEVIHKSGYSIKELQGMLGLSCPQPIYRWMQGKILPSVENLYKMHRIFGVHMEDMLAGSGGEWEGVQLSYKNQGKGVMQSVGTGNLPDVHTADSGINICLPGDDPRTV